MLYRLARKYSLSVFELYAKPATALQLKAQHDHGTSKVVSKGELTYQRQVKC